MMHFQLYRDDAGQYRWRLRSANREIIADSAESYTRKRDALRAVKRLIDLFRVQEEIDIFERLG